MAKLPHPQAPAIFRALFPGLAEWLEAPWAGPPQYSLLAAGGSGRPARRGATRSG
jgi:hypothetical protein